MIQSDISIRTTIDESDDEDDRLPSWSSPFGASALAGGSSSSPEASRRRSLSCSLVDITIIDTELVTIRPGNSHIVYVVQIAPGIKVWTVKRRYTDFVFLDSQLRKTTTAKLPALPKKRIFGSSLDPRFVDDRKTQLEEYLRELVGIKEVWASSAFPRFLDNDNNSMIFLWNFERVRRMQDMLSLMSAENKSDTEKLTAELGAAKQQVCFHILNFPALLYSLLLVCLLKNR
jgi:PX domain